MTNDELRNSVYFLKMQSDTRRKRLRCASDIHNSFRRRIICHSKCSYIRGQSWKTLNPQLVPRNP